MKDQEYVRQLNARHRRTFQKKRMAGARMQEIADEQINKAMLHYYLKEASKKLLSFEAASFVSPRL